MKPEPIFAAIESLKSHNHSSKKAPVILLSPQGRQFNQSIASELAIESELILICGHYEGVDERVKEHLATDEISIGDYILTGGELAAMILVDAVSRLIPGVLGSNNSASQDSFTQDLLEYPQYTRPAVFRGWQIPEIIKSGNHQKIQAWRRQQSILRTLENRPDLLSNAKLEEEDWTFLKYINELNKQSKTQ
jgi:tRNA (guanine37-N1)-methyltransferase